MLDARGMRLSLPDKKVGTMYDVLGIAVHEN